MIPLKLELSTNVSNRFPDGIPPWSGNFNLANSWVLPSDSSRGWGGQINYPSLIDTDVYLQYGSNNRDGYWAAVRFYELHYRVDSETLNPDGSIDAQISFEGGILRSAVFGGGLYVIYEWRMDGKNIGHWEGDTGTPIAKDFTPVTTIVHLEAGQKSHVSNLEINIYYPGSGARINMIVGVDIANNNPPIYTPMSLRDSIWLSLNWHKGFIKRRISNTWKDFSIESGGTSMQENQGHNRIRRDNKFIQLPPMPQI